MKQWTINDARKRVKNQNPSQSTLWSVKVHCKGLVGGFGFSSPLWVTSPLQATWIIFPLTALVWSSCVWETFAQQLQAPAPQGALQLGWQGGVGFSKPPRYSPGQSLLGTPKAQETSFDSKSFWAGLTYCSSASWVHKRGLHFSPCLSDWILFPAFSLDGHSWIISGDKNHLTVGSQF